MTIFSIVKANFSAQEWTRQAMILSLSPFTWDTLSAEKRWRILMALHICFRGKKEFLAKLEPLLESEDPVADAELRLEFLSALKECKFSHHTITEVALLCGI